MKILVASTAGFCPGVKRAVKLAEAACQRGTAVTLGPLVHNPPLVAQLAERGLVAVERLEQVEQGPVLIRAHGTTPEVMAAAQKRGLEIIDATCPFVSRAQAVARALREAGHQVLIVGDSQHPEVLGLVAAAGDAEVIAEVTELDPLKTTGPVGVIAQTTQTQARFQAVKDRLEELGIVYRAVDTICRETQKRQEAMRRLAEESDVVIVVGGTNSANTRQLAAIARECGRQAYSIETANALRPEWIAGAEIVGIAAGASTPDWIMKEVVGKVEELEKKLNPTGEEPQAEAATDQEDAGTVEAGSDNVSPCCCCPTATADPDGPSTEGRPGTEEPKGEEAETPGADLEAASCCCCPDLTDEPADPVTAGEAATQVADEPAEPGAEERSEAEIYEDSLRVLQVGEIVSGKVVSVDDTGVLVDVGYKSEGLIPAQDFSGGSEAELQPGDDIRVYVSSIDNQEGALRLSKRRADEEIAWEELQAALNDGSIIEAEVVQEVKGGLVVDVGLRGFVPASQVERGYVSDLSRYVGQKLRLRPIELDRQKNRAILSQRIVLEEEYESLREETWSTIEEGQVRSGVVKGITDFGVFVDLGGVDGLLHVSELSWGRVKHPTDVVKEGQPIDVMVLRVDREKGKISLGLKQILADPWVDAEARYPVDAIVEGRVTRLAPFGAFVELEEGVEGLVHISEMADRHIAKPEEVVRTDDVVEVKVLRVRSQERRISLSIKEAQAQSTAAPDVGGSMSSGENSGNLTIGDMFGQLLEEGRERFAANDQDDEEDE